MESGSTFKSNLEIKSRLFDIYQNHEDPDFWSQIQKIAPQTETLLKLQQYEKKIDELVKKKFYDFQESLIQPQLKVKRVIRLRIASEVIQGGWMLRVQGQVMKENSESFSKKFTQYFNQIQVMQDNQELFVWKKSKISQEMDGVEFRIMTQRKLDILITPFYIPQIYHIDPKLNNILGLCQATRVQILQAFWDYIKIFSLQDKEDKSFILCNETLKELFGCDELKVDQIAGKIQQFLKPVDPIHIQHELHDTETQEQFLDVIIHQDLPQNSDFGQFFLEEKIDTPQFQKILKTSHGELLRQNPYFLQASRILKIDKRVKYLWQKKDYIGNLKNHLYKKQSYEGYKQDPQVFIEQLLQEQNELLRIMQDKPDLKELYDKPYHSNSILYNQDLLEREVKSYLNQSQIN